MLKGASIEKSFGEQKVLNGINITLEPGKVNVITGPSGAGKTTLLNCLSLLMYPDKGKITIDDLEYSFPVERKIKHLPYPKMTVVFQRLFLFPHLTNYENLVFGLDQPNGEQKDHIDEIIEIFEMKDFIHKRTNHSSLGQNQRVAIARALMVDPEYILLDEVTASLDKVQVSNILNVLVKLKEKNIGLLMVSHDPLIARYIADQVLFMSDGRIAEAGDKRIFENPKSKELQEFMKKIIF